MTLNIPASDTPHRKPIRLAAARYRGGGRVFLVTACTEDRHPWFSLHPVLADQATAVIDDLVAARGTILYAWCVMPDHVHLLMEDTDVIGYIRAFKGRVTACARRSDPVRRLWMRSFHDHALRDGERLADTARYVLGNPVRAGIVAEASLYRWSGSGVWTDWRSWR